MLSSTVVPGSVRIVTGTWTGTAPSIEQLSLNTAACVWKLNTTSDETEAASVQFSIRDLAQVEEFSPIVKLEPASIGGSAVCAVPEPGAMSFMLVGLALRARRRRGEEEQ